MAEAGILRLELNELSRALLPLEIMLPAPGQGALGIEVRADDSKAIEAIAKLNQVEAHAAVHAERQVLAALHGGCLAPIAALGTIEDQTLRLTATVLSADGKQRLDRESTIPLGESPIESAQQLAKEVADGLRTDGAVELIEASR